MPGRGRGRGRPPGRGRGRGAGISRGPMLQKVDRPNSVDPVGQENPPSSSTAQLCCATTTTTTTTIINTVTTATDPSYEMSEELFSHPMSVPCGMAESSDMTPMDVRWSSDDGGGEAFVPDPSSFCEVSDDSTDEDIDDVSTDATFVPLRGQMEEGESSDEDRDSRRRRRWVEGYAAQGASGSGTLREQEGSLPGVSQPTRSLPSVPRRRSLAFKGPTKSLVWEFYTVSPTDSTFAICKYCKKALSRGKHSTHLGTTNMMRHLSRHHSHELAAHKKNPTQAQRHTAPPPTPPPTLPSNPPTPQGSTVPQPLTCVSPPAQSQMSVMELLNKKKPLPPNHPLCRRLTASLAELLSLQLLPYNLVESRAFKKFVAVGTPQWKVPSRTYFSRTAVPNLYRGVERRVASSLAHSVGARVHLTTDTWSAKHGQGRYITYSAHWVNLLTPGSSGALVKPPRIADRPAATSSPSPTPTPSSSSESSSAAGLSAIPAPHDLPRAYATSQARRCHAVLGLTCLKAESHTARALLDAQNAQVARWLTPHQLEIGTVVSDNGRNLVASLALAKLTHVPCMAHVMNLIVQRFISKYPDLQDVLKQARKVCGHFRRSYTAKARLAEIQGLLNLPVRRLICDTPTRWNSTLMMFDRLLQQEQAVNSYLYELGERERTARLGIILPRYWTVMRNACRLLRPFEDVTNLVSSNNSCISDLVPYAFLLERAVRRVCDQAVDEREQEEEEQLWSPSQAQSAMSSTDVPASTQEEESEESDDDMLEEQEDQTQQASQGASSTRVLGSRGIVRGGWGEEEPLAEVNDEEQQAMHSSASNLVQMGSFMLSSLRRDPRIKKLRENNKYWVATLLDPRYKSKLSDMLPSYDASNRMQQLHQKLKSLLYNAFKGDDVAAQQDSSRGRGTTHPPPPPPRSTSSRTGHSTDVRLLSDLRTYFCPVPRHSPPGSSLKERLDRQVNDYLSSTADLETMTPSNDPLEYWVRRLDLWPELAQFSIELLSCPSSSVLSERTFSAAGGFVTDKRSQLGQDSLEYLTFIKMNEAWIPEGLPDDS